MTEIIWNAGFDEIRFSEERYDSFSDAPQASSAAEFGTQGVNIWAVKPVGGMRDADQETRARTESVPAGDTRPSDGPLPDPDQVFDAGSLGCGDGPLTQIAALMRSMPPGSVLEIRSTDPGVSADLPAWCRMVGHQFLGGGTHEYTGRYLVRRKDG